MQRIERGFLYFMARFQSERNLAKRCKSLQQIIGVRISLNRNSSSFSTRRSHNTNSIPKQPLRINTKEFANETVKCQSFPPAPHLSSRNFDCSMKNQQSVSKRNRSYLLFSDMELILRENKASNTARIARKSEIFSPEAENYSDRVLGASPGAQRS